jgi:hypothetical protein
VQGGFGIRERTLAFAEGARKGRRRSERAATALAGNLNQPKLAHGQNLMLSPITFHGFHELLPDPLPIFGAAQVYKVHHNDPP